MLKPSRSAAILAAVSLVAMPLSLVSASPANAAVPDFRCAGALVDFDVDKERGHFDVDAEMERAKSGSRWRVVLKHDGKRFHKRVHQANARGRVSIDEKRPDTRGKDVFWIKVKKIGGPKACTQKITMR